MIIAPQVEWRERRKHFFFCGALEHADLFSIVSLGALYEGVVGKLKWQLGMEARRVEVTQRGNKHVKKNRRRPE